MKEILFETAFNGYKSVEILGQGGSGIVFEVFDETGIKLALKRLNPTYITAEKRRRFKNEINFCEKNTHKNILTVVDSGFKDVDGTKCPFYVMPQYASTLRKLMDSRIPPQQVLSKFSQILDGVEASHLHGVWHRDLKPENILYDDSKDLLVVADFGIAHFAEAELATLVITKPNARLANFQYAAPEQRIKESNVDHRSDIYALGLILNEMFTGEIIQGTGYKTITSVATDFAYLDQLVDQMIQQNPESRPDSVDDVKKILVGYRNQFVIRQKLTGLKNEVVPESEIDDPLVLSPIEISSMDYQNEELVFHLSNTPNREWSDEFTRQSEGHTSIMGVCSPGLFRFEGKVAHIRAKPNHEQQIVNLFKGYLSQANENYRKRKEKEARKREQDEKERLQKQIMETEKGKKLLENLKF